MRRPLLQSVKLLEFKIAFYTYVVVGSARTSGFNQEIPSNNIFQVHVQYLKSTKQNAITCHVDA